MKGRESSETAELDADQGEVDPSLGAGLGGFMITHQSPLAHQPAEGAPHHPAPGQHAKSLHVSGASAPLHHELVAEAFDPLRKQLSVVTAVHPEQLPRGQPPQHSLEQEPGSVAFRGAGRG